MVTLFEHAHWPLLLSLIRDERYGRDGGHEHPRHRFEVVTPKDPAVTSHLLGMRVACCACGREIRPVRRRHGSRKTHLYLACTCELAVNYGCARGAAARDCYGRILAAVNQRPDTPQQPGLW